MTVQRARELRKRMTTPELVLWNALRALKPLGFHFRRQVPLGRYIADFVCHRHCLVVEVDGESHFGTGVARDRVRDAFLQGEGYRVVHVTNDEVMRNLDGVMRLVLHALEAPHP